ELIECGFRIEEFGKGSMLIRAVPHYLMGKPIKQILRDSLSQGDLQDTKNRYNQVLMMIACKVAVKAGDALIQRERSTLVREWLRTANALSCPHGRPIAKGFRPEDIAPWFHRSE
ncbi:MAG: DNA mismatch repair protein MutL, partial [Candidatus Margulisiibacteriota bacterium]